MLARNPKLTLTLGMAALLTASLLNFAKRWTHGLGEVWPDAILGFFYGVAIALMLLSIWQRTRAHR